MCDVCNHGREAAKQKEEALIAEFGFAVHYIASGLTDSDPAFAYTVGRSPEKPELYINRLPPPQAMRMLHDAARLADEGKINLVHGEVSSELIAAVGGGESYRVRFESCEARAASMAGTIVRNMYYSPEAFQIIWPDAAGLLPGEEGHDERYVQPTYPLDVERMYAEHREDGTPVVTTAVCSKHAHRGEEFSSEEGTTIHYASTDPTLECRVCGKGVA